MVIRDIARTAIQDYIKGKKAVEQKEAREKKGIPEPVGAPPSPVRVTEPSPKPVPVKTEPKKTIPTQEEKEIYVRLTDPSRTDIKTIETSQMREYRKRGYEPTRRTPSDVAFLGLGKQYFYAPSQPVFERQYKTAFETLPPKRKVEYGYRFADISLEELQYYPGGQEYLAEHKEELLERYISSKGGYKEYYKSPDIDILETARKAAGKTGTGSVMKEPWFIREHAWEVITKTPGERKKQYFDILPLPVRAYSAGFHATASATMFPVTLTQAGVKYIRGEGELTDPLGRIRTGKTFLPDISEKLYEVKPGGPSGLISVGISEGIGKLTGEESKEWETAKEYPVETGFATGGEILGLYLGGKAIHAGKVTITRGMQKVGIPSIPLKYSPVQILRKGYWKGKTRLGLVKEVPPETVFKPSALPSGLSYVPGRTISDRIGSVMKAFEKTKVTTAKGKIYYMGVHTTAKPWLKPLTILRKGRESPGVSFAPFGKAAPRFLRITGEPIPTYATRGISLFPRIRLPTAPVLFFKKIKTIPSYLRQAGYKISGKFIKKEPGVYIAPKLYKGGGEYEVIAHGFARRMGVKQFTTIEGVVVPFPKFRLIGEKGLTFAERVTGKIPSGMKRFVSPVSYTGKASIPIFSPSYLASKIFAPSRVSYVPSKKISSFFSIPSYKISTGFSYPSKPSYDYLSIPSYPSKPSKPSYPSEPSIPSYPSPSIPSYLSEPSIPSYSSPSVPSYPGPPVPSVYLPPIYFFDKKIKRKKIKGVAKLGGTRYRFREFKMPSLKQILGGIKI